MDYNHPTNHFLLFVFACAFMALSVIVSVWLSGVELNGCSEQIGYNCSHANAVSQ